MLAKKPKKDGQRGFGGGGSVEWLLVDVVRDTHQLHLRILSVVFPSDASTYSSASAYLVA